MICVSDRTLEDKHKCLVKLDVTPERADLNYSVEMSQQSSLMYAYSDAACVLITS